MTTEPTTERFPLDDRRVYDAYIAGRKSAAIAVAARVGFFDALVASTDGMTVAGVASRFDWNARGARSFVTALEAIGLVERADANEERYTASPDAAAYLTRGTPGSLHGLIDMEVDNFLSPNALLQSLVSKGASVYGDEDPWEAHAADPAKARAFTAAMHSVSERPAAGLAERLDLDERAALLDVGGGSGALSIALARAHPNLRCTIWDIPAVCPLAQEYIDREHLTERVDTLPGDMFKEALPRGFDAVLFSQILHDWNFEQGESLVRKAYDALEPGGMIVVHEKLIEDDSVSPVANALVHLDMLVWTEGQQYRVSELTGLLERVGFSGVERVNSVGYWSFVTGVK